MKLVQTSFAIISVVALTACGHSGSYQTAVQDVRAVNSRIVTRAPAPRAVQAVTATVHHHGRVDVSYPRWDSADPYQPWKSNYAPNLGENGNNDGSSTTGGDNSGGSSSNGTY